MALLVWLAAVGAACETELLPGESADDDPDTWSIRLGGDGVKCLQSVASDRQDDLIIAGTFVSAVAGGTDLGFGPLESDGPDVFVAKLTPAGDPLWLRTFGGLLEDHGVTAVVDGLDNIYFVGEITMLLGPAGVDFGGGAVHHDGGDQAAIFVVKYAPDGAYLWSQLLYSPEAPAPISAATDDSGNLFVAGRWRAEADFGLGPLGADGPALVKFDPAGSVVWYRALSLEDVGISHVTDVAAAPGGDAIITGSIRLASGALEELVARYSPDGELVSARTDFGPGQSRAVAVLPDGDIAVLGARIMRLSPDGDVRWARPRPSAFDSAFDELSWLMCPSTWPHEIATTPSGEIIARDKKSVVGFSAEGAQQWEFTPEVTDIHGALLEGIGVLADDRVVVAGTFSGVVRLGGDSHHALGAPDMFLAIPAR